MWEFFKISQVRSKLNWKIIVWDWAEDGVRILIK